MAEALRESIVQYPSEGATVRAYLVHSQAKEKRAAVIVVQEWWGLNDHIKDIARRYAGEGYVAIAPDLYSRLGHTVTADPDEAGKLMNSLRQEDGLKDLNATVAYLKTAQGVDSNRLGVTGFCMGGSYALMLPCVNSAIKAAVPFYGWIPNPDTPLQKLACPILYICGETDTYISKGEVHRLADALKKYKKQGEIKSYPGAGHAFFRDTDKHVYRPDQAKDAWARTLAFFKQHLA